MLNSEASKVVYFHYFWHFSPSEKIIKISRVHIFDAISAWMYELSFFLIKFFGTTSKNFMHKIFWIHKIHRKRSKYVRENIFHYWIFNFLDFFPFCLESLVFLMFLMFIMVLMFYDFFVETLWKRNESAGSMYFVLCCKKLFLLISNVCLILINNYYRLVGIF